MRGNGKGRNYERFFLVVGELFAENPILGEGILPFLLFFFRLLRFFLPFGHFFYIFRRLVGRREDVCVVVVCWAENIKESRCLINTSFCGFGGGFSGKISRA